MTRRHNLAKWMDTIFCLPARRPEDRGAIIAVVTGVAMLC